MDTKKLRQKLLDLAVRGKLVPQDPNDEPASELLSRIREEKLAMVERGELKPKDVKNDTVIYFGSDGLPYEKRADGKGEAKCIEGEIPFDLPEGWSWARVNAVCPVGTGATPLKANKAYYKNGTIPWITSGSATKGAIFEPDGYITELALRETNCVVYPAESLVVAMYGEGKTRGSVATLRIDAATNQACAVLRKIEKGCLQSYVKICYENSYDVLRAKAQGGNQPNLNLSVVSDLLVPIPPLAEQHRIVNALDKYLALVDAIERDRADLDNLFAQLKSKVLDLAVRGELTQRDPGDEPACELLARIHAEKLALVERGELKSKDIKGDTVIFTGSDGLRYEKPADGKGEPRCIEDEIPFELPEGWAWARFSNIVRKIGSKDNQVKTKGLLKNGDYPVISQSASSYVDGYYSGTIQPITSVPVLLFGDHTRTVKYINQPFVIGADGTKCHNAIGINPVFLFHAMQVAAERIENRGYGRHYALLERYLLAIPPLAEQRRINSAIEAIISATNL